MRIRTMMACACTLAVIPATYAGDQQQRTTKDTTALLATASANPLPTAAPATAASAVALQQQPSGFASWPVLTGNWGGARPALEAAGVTFSAMYRTDQMSTVAGGSEARGSSINQLDLQLAIDADAAFGIGGMTLFAHVIANNGGSVSRWVGDAQIVSNLEATRLAKLYQFWVRQSFFDDRLSLLAGLYDLNAEFYANETAGLFLNSSFGIGKELAQAGPNGPGIFPNPGLTLRVRADIDGMYGQAAVIDGHPGTSDDPFAPSFSWNKDEGVLLIAEGGVIADGGDDGLRSKFAAGAWWYPSSTEMPLTNGGAYLLAEHQVIRGGGDEQGLTLFARIGVADLRVNRFRSNFSGGAVYTGLIPGRAEDKLGLAFTVAQRNLLLDASEATEPVDRAAETTIELAYRIQLVPSVAVQPDFQFVIAPDCSRHLPNASVLGVRFEGRF
jgi:porin